MSGRLLVDPRLSDPDAFYDRLISLYRERGDEQCRLIDARLILLLANHIGDALVLDEALSVAAQSSAAEGSRAGTAVPERSAHEETR